jgi:hypothetical protein
VIPWNDARRAWLDRDNGLSLGVSLLGASNGKHDGTGCGASGELVLIAFGVGRTLAAIVEGMLASAVHAEAFVPPILLLFGGQRTKASSHSI